MFRMNAIFPIGSFGCCFLVELNVNDWAMGTKTEIWQRFNINGLWLSSARPFWTENTQLIYIHVAFSLLPRTHFSSDSSFRFAICTQQNQIFLLGIFVFIYLAFSLDFPFRFDMHADKFRLFYGLLDDFVICFCDKNLYIP